MWKKFALASARLFRRPPAVARVPTRFSVGLQTRLLLSLTAGGEGPAAGPLVCATHNVSETGLALAVPEPAADARLLEVGDAVRLSLEIYPSGVVEMEGAVVRREAPAGGRRGGRLFHRSADHRDEPRRSRALRRVPRDARVGAGGG